MILKINFIKDVYIDSDDIEKIKQELNLLSIFDTREPQIPNRIKEEMESLKIENEQLYSTLESRDNEILVLKEKNKELIQRKEQLDFMEKYRITLSYKSIIKGLLGIIDKINGKKRIFSSPRGKITTNEISKEILTIIEENPNDFLDDKIKDRTIRKYLGDVLKEIKDD